MSTLLWVVILVLAFVAGFVRYSVGRSLDGPVGPAISNLAILAAMACCVVLGVLDSVSIAVLAVAVGACTGALGAWLYFEWLRREGCRVRLPWMVASPAFRRWYPVIVETHHALSRRADVGTLLKSSDGRRTADARFVDETWEEPGIEATLREFGCDKERLATILRELGGSPLSGGMTVCDPALLRAYLQDCADGVEPHQRLVCMAGRVGFSERHFLRA